MMYATFWSLVPPLVAIILALITKEVYSSLFVGIVTAALFCANFHVVEAYTTMFSDGFIASLADSSNVGILIFLVILGTIVVLMNKAGGSAAYGKWAQEKIKTRKGTLFATFGLGCLVFVDDYFNCLTVGSVMRPVTDKHSVSRAKLAYLIDATAAPICMIAPISSWAAAVAGVVEGTDGLELFIRAIPYNLYSLLTIATILIITSFDIDFGLMKKHEDNAKKGDLFTSGTKVADDGSLNAVSNRGRVIDLAFPVIVLIISCIVGMIYTGGFFEGESFVNSFANCDAPVGLSMGSTAALLVTVVFYLCRKVLSFKDCMDAFPEGFKAMISPILILTFAWTLSGLTGKLGAAEYVSGIFEGSASGLTGMLPAIVFLVAIFLSFSTGTSWGTFGILLPIVVEINLPGNLLIITIAACLAGAVCGDHCSPISDTTIMASAGAQCDHINHVSTQLPYAMLVAVVSFIGYCIAGFIQNAWIVLAISLVMLFAVLFGVKKFLVPAD
ncbi:MAG: Na+/H+ antiporter NhaC family protein [Clostridiales bacterium]|nr:Na+/H+ antiporter NhaC family protein [Clostridiales bacterium]